MKQLVTVEEPVPSLQLHSLVYDDGWSYVYEFTVPELLDETDRGAKYTYGHFADMVLKDSIKPNMMNIEVRTLSDLKRVMDRQRASDLRAREEFITDQEPMTFIVENKSQRASGKWAVREVKNDGEFTTFIGRATCSRR